MTQTAKTPTLAASQDLRIFIAISEANTLDEAARLLELPLTTVSRALKRMEASASVTLVQQDAKGIVLTELGRQYLHACTSVLEAHRRADEVLLAYRKVPPGTLSISVPVIFATHVLSLVIFEFQQKFPSIKIDLALYSSQWDQKPKTVYDLFIKIKSPNEPRDHKLLPGIRQGLFASPRYLADHSVPKELCELEKHTCLGYDRTGVLGPWHFSDGQKRFEMKPDFHIVAPDPSTLAHLAVEGTGIAMLPLWLAHEFVVLEELVPVLSQCTVDPLVFCVLRGDRLQEDPQVEAFLQLLDAIVGSERDPRCQGEPPSCFFV